jgi:hypothetical protein
LNNSTNTTTTAAQNDVLASQPLPPKSPPQRRTKAIHSSTTSTQALSSQTTPTPLNRSQSTRGNDRANSVNTAARPSREILIQQQQQQTEQNVLNKRKNKLQELLNLAEQGKFPPTLFKVKKKTKKYSPIFSFFETKRIFSNEPSSSETISFTCIICHTVKQACFGKY